MAAPPNTTAAAATVMTFPFSATVDVIDAAPPHYEVWYTYVPDAADIELGWWAVSEPVYGYHPRTAVFTGTVGSLVPWLGITAAANPIQIPIAPPTQYFFRVRHDGVGTPAIALLSVSTVRAQNVSVPVGGLAINDDVDGFPLVIYTAGDGTVSQVRPDFPSGETGDALPNGISLWQDRAAGVLRLYDATFTLVTTPAWTYSGGDPPISSNRVNRFYVGSRSGGSGGQALVSTISQTGVVGPTTWTLPEYALEAIAPNLAETVLYYYGPISAGISEIRRWDLVNDVALASLAASISGYLACKPILDLADDTVIVGYYNSASGALDSLIRHYAADGTVLHTYPLGRIQLNKLTHAVDDPLSFWTWSFVIEAAPGVTPTGVSRFSQLRVSDGAVVATFDAPMFRSGESAADGSAVRFGHSNSCPFITLKASLPPWYPPGTPPGTLEPPHVAPATATDQRYLRRLRRAPHVNSEHTRVFFRTFELDLERGQGLATGQGSDPIVLLRLSRDGGQTWGEEIRMHAGALGAYTQRCLARRLGQARDTVFEVTVSDPIAWSLVGAWLDLEGGTS